MIKFQIIPKPQVLIKIPGRGTKINPVSMDRSSKEVAKEIIENGYIIPDEYNFNINYVSLDEFSQKYGYSYGYAQKFDHEEGYMLYIGDNIITVGSASEKGRFYAVQTLAQIITSIRDGYIPGILIIDWPNIKMRSFNLCYHMVSETMPIFGPNYETTIRLIEDYAHFKMNTVVMEFEGMFPYKKYPQLNNKFAFTPEQIKGIYTTCKKNHISIIPLVQCLGHAYSVLRHPEFAHLRELPNTTQQYCPCNQESRELYFELIDEIIEAFPGIKYFHIGGDEARRLGKCPKCKKKLLMEGMGALYGDHVNEIGEYINSKNIKPIIWGDIMETHPDIIDRLRTDLAIVYWNYDIVDWSRPYALEKFIESGKEIIIGSAAKFGTHSDYMFLYKKSMRNVSLIASEALRTKAAGILVTDWMKLAPTEVAIIANVYGAQTSWNNTYNQSEFCKTFSKIYFGLEIEDLDNIFKLVSETTLIRGESINGHLSAPYSDANDNTWPDFRDRFDPSGRDFKQLIIKYTKQETFEAVNASLKTSIEKAVTALKLIEESRPNIAFRNRIFDVLYLAAKTQYVKGKMGIAINTAVRLLKYPCPNEEEERFEVAQELRKIIDEWHKTREFCYENLLPGTYQETIDNAIDFKFDPEAVKYMKQYASLLESGENIQYLIDI